MSSASKDPRDVKFGLFVKERLRAIGMTIPEAARLLDREPITLYKVCSGDRRFAGDMRKLAEILQVEERKLAKLRRDRTPVADTVKLARANTRTLQALQERETLLTGDDLERREDLLRSQRQINLQFLEPFLGYMSRIDGLEAGLHTLHTLELPQLSTGENLGEQRAIIVSALGSMSEATAKAASLGIAGAAAGTAVGGTAAFALFAGVAAFATASTGTAIAGLSGAAATSATLAALGGGSLAAGGMGVAGGTAILASVVAAPALLGIGVGAFFADRYAFKKISEKTDSLDVHQLQLDRAEKELRIRWGWARKQIQILEKIAISSSSGVAQIGRLLPPDKTVRVGWNEFPEIHEDVEKLVVLLTFAVTAMNLPTWSNLVEMGDREEIHSIDETYTELLAQINGRFSEANSKGAR